MSRLISQKDTRAQLRIRQSSPAAPAPGPTGPWASPPGPGRPHTPPALATRRLTRTAPLPLSDLEDPSDTSARQQREPPFLGKKSAERHCDATASSLPAPDAPAPQDNAQADRQGATPLKKTEPLTCPDVHCNNRVPRGRGRKSSPGTTGAAVCRDPRFVSPSLQGLCFHVCRERSRYWTHANRPKGSLSLRSARSRPGGSGRCLRHVSKGNRWEAGKQESASVDRGAKYADDCPERLDGDKRWDARLPAGRPGVRTPLPTGQPRGSAVRPQRLADPQGPHECPGRPLRTRHFLVPTQAVKTEPTPPSRGTRGARC